MTWMITWAVAHTVSSTIVLLEWCYWKRKRVSKHARSTTSCIKLKLEISKLSKELLIYNKALELLSFWEKICWWVLQQIKPTCVSKVCVCSKLCSPEEAFFCGLLRWISPKSPPPHQLTQFTEWAAGGWLVDLITTELENGWQTLNIFIYICVINCSSRSILHGNLYICGPCNTSLQVDKTFSCTYGSSNMVYS